MLLLVSTLHILALLIQNPMVYNVVILIGQMRLTIAGPARLEPVLGNERPRW